MKVSGEVPNDFLS